MKKKEFVTGVMSLTLSMLVIQSMSMGFSVYVSGRFGAAQMGLFHLVMSVYSFALTVAMSGVPLAATRLVSESSSRSASGRIVKKCICISLVFGFVSFISVFAFSGRISAHMLGDQRTELPLKILSVALPFISVSGVLRGYFTGIQKVSCITVSRMAEEFSYMFIMLMLMKMLGTQHTGVFISAVALASSAVIACTCDFCMYALALRKRNSYIQTKSGFRSVLSIAMPVAAGSYLRSGLVAAENLLIPSALTKSGTSNSLARYGTVKAMAMPVITFPYVFLQSFTSLLVPEISARKAKQNKNSVRRAAVTSLKYTFVFATVIAVVLIIFGRKLALILYNDTQAGNYITSLALLTIPMYIDSVTDGILKGLNQQVYSLKINIIDSALRVPVIYMLLPHTGIYGYIAVLYASEILNLTLSFKRLKKIL